MKAVIINRPLKAENLWEGLRWLRAEKTPNGETAGQLQSGQKYHNYKLTSCITHVKRRRGAIGKNIIKKCAGILWKQGCIANYYLWNRFEIEKLSMSVCVILRSFSQF